MPDQVNPTSPTQDLASLVALLQRIESVGKVGTWTMDTSSEQMSWSPQLKMLFGIEPDLGPSLELFLSGIHSEDISMVKTRIHRLVTGRIPFQIEFKKKTNLNTYQKYFAEGWVENKGVTSNDQVFGLVKELSHSRTHGLNEEDKLSIVLNTSPETIWCLDAQYKLIFGNSRFFESILKLHGQPIHVGDSILDDRYFGTEDFLFWKENYDKALKGQKVTFTKKRLLNEKTIHHQVQIVPIWESDSVIALSCYSQNISQQIEEEIQNRELVEKLNQSQKIGKLGYWEFDIATEDIFWSDEVYNIWGLDKEKVKPNFELFTKSFVRDDLDDFIVEHHAALRGERKLDAIHRIICTNGQIKFVHEKGQLEKDPETGNLKFKGTVQDITYQRTIENELRERNTFIEATLRNLPMGIAVNKIDTGETTFINPAFSSIYGWPETDLKDVSTFFEKVYPDPEFRAKITQQIIGDIQSGDPSRMSWPEIPISTQSGETRIVSAKNIPLFEQNLMISTVVDETERYRAEQDTKKSNERFHLATQAVSDAIWDWDTKSDKIFWGKGYHRLFGYPEEMEFVSPDFWNSKVHPEDLKSTLDSIMAARANPHTTRWTGEYRLQRSDGTYAFVKENTIIIRDRSGQTIRMVGALQDVTEEKKNQLLLAQKTKFIQATAKVVELFLENEDWESHLMEMLHQMGETAGADRAYFIQIYEKEGETYGKLSHEWTNGKVESFSHLPEYQAIPVKEHPDFWKKAFNRKPYSLLTRETEGATKAILEAQDILSILHIPVFLDNIMVGYLGFDDCHEEHIWTEDEKNFMNSIATNLSFAIARKRYLDQLQVAFETHDMLLESIRDSFFAIDKNYLVTYWNSTVEHLTGIRKEDIIGKSIWDFVNPRNEEFEAGYKRAFEEQTRINFETFDRWTQTWLEATIYPTREGLSVIIKNINEKKESEKQIQEFNERLSLISKASHDAIWDWNVVTGEHYWGEGFNYLFDEEIAGIQKDNHRWLQSIHPEDKESVFLKLQEILQDPSKSTFESEYRFIKKNKSFLYLLDKGTIIRNEEGKPIRIVGAIQDITRRKAYEESLRILNSELAKSIRDLEISNKELEQFAYVASHDLQEPLRMITSFLTLLEKKYKENLDEKGRSYINYAVDGAKRMRDIILDLLEFSRIGNIVEAKKKVNANDLIEEVLKLNSKVIQEKQAQIQVAPLPEIVCHPSAMIQVFQNLISNALKYQAEGVKPEISIDYTDKGKYWEFRVRDNGIGIDKEYAEKIFIIFQRLHQKEQYSGSGIGLAICKKIVEIHGGKIWVDSSLGQGSTFFFTITKL